MSWFSYLLKAQIESANFNIVTLLLHFLNLKSFVDIFSPDGGHTALNHVLTSGALGLVVVLPAPYEVDDGGDTTAAEEGHIHGQVEVVRSQEERYHVPKNFHAPGKQVKIYRDDILLSSAPI